MDGTIVHPRTYEALPLREDILTTVRRVERQAEALGAMAALEHIYDTVKAGSDASYLRGAYERSGSCEGMVDAAIRVFRLGGSWAPR